MPHLTRRQLLASAAGTALIGSAVSDQASAADAQARRSVPHELDAFIRDYMKAMDAPGLTLALADARGTVAVATYGWVDPAARTPVSIHHRFQIGSISKSFVAIVILQLQDEGRLDVHDPVFRHLPWLPAETSFGEISLHHLLTHTSGMPSDDPVFPDCMERRSRQASAPGTHFHYSNWGYAVLGLVIESVEGVSIAESIRRRILAPLGMNDSAGGIVTRDNARMAQSYMPSMLDRPFVRGAALAVAPCLIVQDASGCVAATPGDMAQYLQMLVNQGAAPGGHILSRQGFDLFSAHHTPADEFGNGASYGYGIAVDEFDGHRRLRHTGGMVSFMSSLQVDLDARVAAFSSVNAQLGYRPDAVTEYALRLMRAAAERRKAPAAPPTDELTRVETPNEYTGSYREPGGHSVTVAAHGPYLFLSDGGRTWPMQVVDEDTFAVDDPAWMPFSLRFERESPRADGARPVVIALDHGERQYFRDGQNRPGNPGSPDLRAYPGTYHSEDPWHGTVRILARGQRLWFEAGSSVPMKPIGPSLFRFDNAPDSPETCEFGHFVSGRAQTLLNSGVMFRRIGDAGWPA